MARLSLRSIWLLAYEATRTMLRGNACPIAVEFYTHEMPLPPEAYKVRVNCYFGRLHIEVTDMTGQLADEYTSRHALCASRWIVALFEGN